MVGCGNKLNQIVKILSTRRQANTILHAFGFRFVDKGFPIEEFHRLTIQEHNYNIIFIETKFHIKLLK